MNTNWNFGIIGAGMIADFHAKAILDIPNTSIAGFCDGGSGKSTILAKKYDTKAYMDYHEMLNDPDINIVTIATPSGHHMEPAILAAKKGIHVLCEKPLEITPQRIDQMILAHKAGGTYLGGIFNFRYNPVIGEIKSAIQDGRLGKITFGGVYVPWWRNESYYANNWKGTKKLDGGGALMNQSIHMVDLIQYLLGPVRTVSAFTDALYHDIEVEDTAVAILRFANGALGQVYGTTASFPGHLRRMEITGTSGTICVVEDSLTVWDFREPLPMDKVIKKKYGQVMEGGGAADPAAMTHINHSSNIRAFLTAIENGEPFDVDGTEAKKAVEIICAIYESQKKGGLVNLTSPP